jgi:two-component system, OmpR family, sensor histidine kinase ChvG
MVILTQLIRFMAPDTDLAKPDPPGLALRWSGRLPLAARILAVNTLPIALLAGSFFYIDGFRSRLIAERRLQAEHEAQLIAAAVQDVPMEKWPVLVKRLEGVDKVRIRLIDALGNVKADSWANGKPSFVLRDPEQEAFQRKAARWLDEGLDWIVDAQVPPTFRNFEGKLPIRPNGSELSLAPDRSHMIEARARVIGRDGYSIVTLRNARDIRRFVRVERSLIGNMIGLATLVSIFLSLFLARTIVRPLQLLGSAAQQVRFGRAREVQVPRLPSRADEIGQLARAISDMSQALRRRMDAVEAFAADVAHELKNPLASLASAVEGLRNVKKPDHAAQLHDVIADDVRRLDRLITDISDLSRVDAKMSRTGFSTVDIGTLLEGLIASHVDREHKKPVSLTFARPQTGSALVRGDAGQLGRVFDNLLDNAVSFSPEGGCVRISATRTIDQVVVKVDDDGPGVPKGRRETIFDRFHSDRPESEFGQHSGLGLAIARTIIEGHGGTIRATVRERGATGACFIVTLPPAIPAG